MLNVYVNLFSTRSCWSFSMAHWWSFSKYCYWQILCASAEGKLQLLRGVLWSYQGNEAEKVCPYCQTLSMPWKRGEKWCRKKKKCIYLMHFTAIWLTRLCFSPSYIVTSGVCRKRLFAITLKMGGDLWVWQTAEESPRVCNTLGSINEDAEKACSILSLP